MKKVLIFGGKFNPIHTGHKHIINDLAKKLVFDEIWIMPNGLAKNQQFISEETRLRLIKNFCKKNNYKFIDFEYLQENYVDTIETARYFTKKYNYDFSFLIGADQALDFKNWPKAKELAQLFKIICVSRKGYQFNKSSAFKIEYIESDPPKASSTDIREGNLNLLEKEDLKIMAQDTKFWLHYLKSTLSNDRFNHSLNVGDKSKELALKYLPKKANEAYLAGLLHDITKEWNDENHARYIEQNIIKEEPKATWHQWSGAAFVKEIGINDKDIISSIKNHTTTDMEMSDFDKIIFCADKTSKERSYEELPKILKACQISLNECFDACFDAKITFLEKKQIPITKRTKKLINRWK